MRLHHCRVGIHIHYQTGQEIALAVNEAEGIIRGQVADRRRAH